jgi:hypothetical protein
MTTHLRRRVEVLEHQHQQALVERLLRTLSDAEIDAICRGGPGEVNLTSLNADQVDRLIAGKPLEDVVPHWRELVNP